MSRLATPDDMASDPYPIKLFCGNSHPELAKGIAEKMKLPVLLANWKKVLTQPAY